ncbi:MAG TPA: VC0807 family protein [Actinomycetes bacterium]
MTSAGPATTAKVTSPDASRPAQARRAAWWLVRAGVGLAVPVVIYYGLRYAGASVYLAVLGSTVVSVVPSAVTLLRERRLDHLSTYAMAMMLGALVLSLVSGSPRFLLAKGALLTGATGVWFLVSARGPRPLAYTFIKPLLEGRLGWPDGWDAAWAASPRFQRMWRVSSVLWGIGTLADAALRVVMAWSLPPDRVPLLANLLYGVTTAALIVITNIWYIACGAWNRRSALWAGTGVPGSVRADARVSSASPRR